MKINYPASPKAIRINFNYERNTYVRMFQEDIVLGIMPRDGTSKNFLDFNAKFIGDKTDNIQAIEVCKSFIDNSYRNDESYTICQCIEDIAKSLTWDGTVRYEILFDRTKKKFHFSEISPTSIYEVPFGLIQIIPKNNESKKRVNFLKSKHTWKLIMPDILGGGDRFKNILENLRKFDSSGPEFYMKDLERGSLSNSFNYINYRHVNHIFLRKSTLNWGWDLRDIDREEKTEVYQYYQDLTFLWARAVLREYIISELNNLLKKLKINSTIEVSGIPRPKEILKFRQEIIDGHKSFDDVLKFIFY